MCSHKEGAIMTAFVPVNLLQKPVTEQAIGQTIRKCILNKNRNAYRELIISVSSFTTNMSQMQTSIESWTNDIISREKTLESQAQQSLYSQNKLKELTWELKDIWLPQSQLLVIHPDNTLHSILTKQFKLKDYVMATCEILERGQTNASKERARP